MDRVIKQLIVFRFFLLVNVILEDENKFFFYLIFDVFDNVLVFFKYVFRKINDYELVWFLNNLSFLFVKVFKGRYFEVKIVFFYLIKGLKEFLRVKFIIIIDVLFVMFYLG